MALIRGYGSDFPCPICLVPKEKMGDGEVHALRTTKTMKKVYGEAHELRTVEAREKHLKGYGLRGIKVCLMLKKCIHYIIPL